MKKTIKSLLIYLIPIAVIAYFISYNSERINETKDLRIDQFIEYIQDTNIKDLEAKGSNYSGTLKDGTKFKVFLPDEIRRDFYNNYLKDPVEKKQIELTGEYEPGKPWYLEILPTALLLIGMVVIWFLFMNQTQGGNNKALSFGKSKAKLNQDENNRITFADVAGLKEEKEELEEIVDFLRNPKKYIQIGARIPKGVLMVGPPGTGKTYLSRAVAGEAKVPFFSISGSDFVEMFVGVGASRVRDLFEQAKKNNPCIVFIDEIDAVGRKRGAGLGGGHDEREQTLNQLLVEMDGFGKNEGIIVMAATNRPDILDPAILRPGRFDRNIYVGMPDVREREEILKVHTRKKNLDTDVNLQSIAKTTSGFSPADLENLTNEAALLAARHNQLKIEDKDFKEAAIKVVAGPEKKSAVVIERERKLTAYHEAGHAIVSTLLPDTDKVHMITIVPRGTAGGFTAYQPEEDIRFMTKTSMKYQVVSLLGGRAAEAVVLDDISTGASNDIERATEIVRAMVKKYGMSDSLGPVNYGNDNGQVFLGNEIGKAHDYSEKIAYEIDVEVQKMIEWAYGTAINVLKENLELLHCCAKELLEHETIHEEQFIDMVKTYQKKKKHTETGEIEEQKEGESNGLGIDQ